MPELGKHLRQLTAVDGLFERAQHRLRVHARLALRYAFSLGNQLQELAGRVRPAVTWHVLQHRLELASKLTGKVLDLPVTQAFAERGEHDLGRDLGTLAVQSGLL